MTILIRTHVDNAPLGSEITSKPIYDNRRALIKGWPWALDLAHWAALSGA